VYYADFRSLAIRLFSNPPDSYHLAADSNISSEQLFTAHALRVLQLQSSRFSELIVHRDSLWRTALGFCKNSLHNHERLQYKCWIGFEGEEGIDTGALRAEFFQNLMKLVNDNWFEGNSSCHVPKKDCNLERNFEICGMIAHSILQGGPGFPCLCPPVFSYILYGDKDKALQELQIRDDSTECFNWGSVGFHSRGTIADTANTYSNVFAVSAIRMAGFIKCQKLQLGCSGTLSLPSN